MLYGDMFRLERVIIRLPLKTYLKCTMLLCTFGIPKGSQVYALAKKAHPCKPFGISNVYSYFVHLEYGFKGSLMMTLSS